MKHNKEIKKKIPNSRLHKKRLNYFLSACFITVLFVIIVSCNKNSSKITFDHVENRFVDTIPIQHIFSPTFMTLTQDLLMITSYGSGEMLHFYKIPALQHLYSTGRKGQGPHEFQVFPMIGQTTNANKLYIWGYTPITINEWIIHNDSLVLNKKYQLSHYENFNQLHIVQDSIFVYSAIPSDFSIKKYDLKANREIEKIALKMDEHREPFYSSNYGLAAANDSCIVYAYYYKKQIDIYDIFSLKLKKRISDNSNDQTPIVGDNDNNIQQYIGLVAGKKYFYALYQGRSRKNKTINSDAIEVFDYEGNSVVKYTFDICPQIFTIDETNHILYGYCFEFEDYLLKCNL
ncbi:MAG: TolB-like 6-bladed beta-propeller domain-containing protein [Prevotellaceae bacterium]|nr:TolB-like 6-bladed beta-propeller domain-containing protein [Prevotellaceae bacterium]